MGLATHVPSLVPETSRHKCLIYDGDPSEQLPVVIPFLMSGLEGNWRCLYMGSPAMVEMVETALISRGVDVDEAIRGGSLILTGGRDHLEAGRFEPKAMVNSLAEMIDQAVHDGYEGLCATGDMAWEMGNSENFEQLLEYEARLEELFQEKPLRGICQYHRELVPARSVRNALLTHRSAYIGTLLNTDNLFYMPPHLLADDHNGTAAKQGDWMCQQILRVMEAEHRRDTAMKALKESEASQRELAEELAEMNRFLEQRVKQRTAELEQANKDLEAFSYSVSHDLRAPLQAILGFAEIMENQSGEALGEDGRKRLARVLTNAARMKELIDGLLELSGATRAELRREAVDFSGLAEEVGRELREREPNRAAEIDIQPGMRVVGDRALLRDVLVNLLENAWKFTSKAAQTRIEVAEEQSELGEQKFLVRDNGAGFDMDRAGKLFEPFERLHRESEFPGTGIGLATVKRIIAKHGGRIWAESRPGQGATFWFTLG